MEHDATQVHSLIKDDITRKKRMNTLLAEHSLLNNIQRSIPFRKRFAASKADPCRIAAIKRSLPNNSKTFAQSCFAAASLGVFSKFDSDITILRTKFGQILRLKL